MKEFWLFVRYILWDWWHGRDTGFYETTRGLDFDAPAFSLGQLDIPRWVVYALILLLIVAAIIAAIIGISSFDGITLTSEESLSTATTLTKIGSCWAFDSMAKRLYVATDCLGSTLSGWLFAALLFLAGYFTRYLQEKTR